MQNIIKNSDLNELDREILDAFHALSQEDKKWVLENVDKIVYGDQEVA